MTTTKTGGPIIACKRTGSGHLQGADFLPRTGALAGGAKDKEKKIHLRLVANLHKELCAHCSVSAQVAQCHYVITIIAQICALFSPRESEKCAHIDNKQSAWSVSILVARAALPSARQRLLVVSVKVEMKWNGAIEKGGRNLFKSILLVVHLVCKSPNRSRFFPPLFRLLL